MMTNKGIVNNADNYQGEYVTTKDWDNANIISHAVDPILAYQEAQKLGYESPVLIYIRSDNDLDKYQVHHIN